MKNDDNPSIIKRFLNWFFPKKLYDPLDKKIENEPKQKLDNKDTAIDEKLEKLKQYIKVDKELDSLDKKYNKSFENKIEDEIDLS
tara:strand:- start:470 stop:724 length:255 start_codon:yes stop_codon:yes gene_type:complete